MKKNNSMSFEKAGEYFDNHDAFKGGEAAEVTEIEITIPRKKYVGLSLGLFKKIRSRARKLHVSEDRLIHTWLKEKVG